MEKDRLKDRLNIGKEIIRDRESTEWKREKERMHKRVERERVTKREKEKKEKKEKKLPLKVLKREEMADRLCAFVCICE